MTQYSSPSNISETLYNLQRQINDLRTQPRLTSASIDRGGTQSSDYNGTDINTPGNTGWFIGTDEATGVGYVHIDGVTFADTGWIQLTTYSTNWSGYTSGSWAGVWYRRLNGIVQVAGAITKSIAVVAGETAFTLPVGFRPTVRTIGHSDTGLWPQANTNGAVTVAGGAVPSAMNIMFIAN